MRPRKDRKTELLLWGLLLLPILWFAAALAQVTSNGSGLISLIDGITALMNDPLSLRWSQNTGVFLLVTLIIYPLAVYTYKLDMQDRHPGEEHGTAKYGTVEALNEKYKDKKDPFNNYIFSSKVRFSMDSHYHMHNHNVMVIGGSGSGKTRFYVKPNAMQCNCSYIFLDPKGELLRSLGNLYEKEGIAVTVLDLIHFRGYYNPMSYIRTDEDAFKLATALVMNTKDKNGNTGGDEFWDRASIMLIAALILYLIYEAPPEEQNFSTLLYLVRNCQISEDSLEPNPLELLFSELEQRDPFHPAVAQFKSFMLGASKTIQSVLITAASQLYMFDSKQFAKMTSRDETFIPLLGTEKRAIFCIIPDNDTTFNFVITILYTQLFQQLYDLADDVYKGQLPVHVRFMMDEFANVSQPKDFPKIIATCRSRNIGCDIILQSKAQLQALYKDDWEGISGNCDTTVYLGGNENGTHEYISKMMGKETERTKSESISKGAHGNSSESYQSTARDLATPDEVRRMRDKDCLLFLRSEPPVVDEKYDILKHPKVQFTTDGKGEPYTMPADHMDQAQSITLEMLDHVAEREITEDMYKELQELEQYSEMHRKELEDYYEEHLKYEG